MRDQDQIILVGDRVITDEELIILKKNLDDKWPDGVPKPIIIIGFHSALKI